MSKTMVDINYVKGLKKYMTKINKMDLKDIIFEDCGDIIEVDDKLIEDWKYTGLNNIDFIWTKYYKGNKHNE